MIHPQVGFLLFFVENPTTSALFYEKILNLQPVQQSPTFVLFALKNGVMLAFWSRYTAEPTVTAVPGAMEISFSDEDIDGIYVEWLKLGVRIAQVPTEMDFGRTFVGLDPDGHRIRIYKLRD